MNGRGGISINKEEQMPDARVQCIDLANTVKCTLGPSKIDGVGVIALRDMKAGERCYATIFGAPVWYQVSVKDLKKHLKDFPEIVKIIMDRWPQVVVNKPFLSPNYDARLICFMNHSDDPNYNPETDCLTKDVKKGEEIFEDYKIFKDWGKAFPWLVEKKV